MSCSIALCHFMSLSMRLHGIQACTPLLTDLECQSMINFDSMYAFTVIKVSSAFGIMDDQLASLSGDIKICSTQKMHVSRQTWQLIS